MKPALEVRLEHYILRQSIGVRPKGAEATDQTGNPVGSLQRLVSTIFQLELGFDEASN